MNTYRVDITFVGRAVLFVYDVDATSHRVAVNRALHELMHHRAVCVCVTSRLMARGIVRDYGDTKVRPVDT